MSENDKKDNNTKDEDFEKLYDNYNFMNKMLMEEMDLSSKHSGITGSFREESWMSFFRNIIPKKFSMEQGVMLIDSDKGISNEVDIAIFDEQYTPYVFQYNKLKYIPIEAVAIVIECKSSSPDKKGLENWVDSIDELKSNPSGIARMATGYICGITNKTQKRTRPIKILTTLKKSNDETNFIEELKTKFDIIIYKDNKNKDNKFEVLIANDNKELGWWARSLNQYNEPSKDEEETKKKFNEESETKNTEEDNRLIINCYDKSKIKLDEIEILNKDDKTNDLYVGKKLEDLNIEGNPLLSLNFKLNQLLMLINNPMLFPHFAYAERFKNIIESENEKNDTQG